MEPAGTQPAAPAQAKAGGDLTIMVKRLAEKMAGDPKNGDGWLLLARTYGELQQPREAADAYSKAASLLPADAAVLADWAAVVVASHDNKWDEQSRGILKRALATDPKHLKSLALAGAEAFARDDKRKAIEYWEQLKKLAPADSPEAKLADANLAEARPVTAGKAAGGVAATAKPAAPVKPAP
jgi:cytochrome c-type biogenesis protein CcmH